MEASEAESKEGSTCIGEDQYTPFLQVQRTESGDVLLLLERNKIKTVGVPALSRFLGRLQVYKSTADIESARAMFTEVYITFLWHISGHLFKSLVIKPCMRLIHSKRQIKRL